MDYIKHLDHRLQIFANLFLVSNKLQVTMDQRNLDITSKQWFVLAALSYLPQAPTLKELAANLDYSHQNIRQLVRKLEDKGYVQVKKDPIDQRAIRIYLTKEVEKWEQAHQADQQAFIQQMYRGISPESLKIVNHVLDQLYENLGDMNEKA